MSLTAGKEELGIWVLQDHRTPIDVSMRKYLAGVRLIDPKGGDDEWGGYVYDEEDGKGTAGDIHPFRWWKNEDRDMGSWAQSMVCRVAGIGTGAEDPGVTGGPGSPPVDLLPLRKSNYVPDRRYAKSSTKVPGDWPLLPMGYVVLGAAGTEEGSQQNLLGSLDPRIIVADKSPRGAMSSMFCDLEPGDQISPKRSARSHTAFRVVLPLDLPYLKTQQGPALALQFTKPKQEVDKAAGSGHQPGFGIVYGLVEARKDTLVTTPGDPGGRDPTRGPVVTENDQQSGPPQDSARGSYQPRADGQPGVTWVPAGGGGSSGGATVAPGQPQEGVLRDPNAPKPPRAAVAFLSREAFGPIHLGCEDDKHQHGTTADGEVVNSGHVAVKEALYYLNVEKDAPLEFSELDYPYPGPLPMKARVHLSYAKQDVHPWMNQTRPGLWRWWSETTIFNPAPPPTTITPSTPTPDPKPPPTTGGPTTPGPTTPGPEQPGIPEPEEPPPGEPPPPSSGTPTGPGTIPPPSGGGLPSTPAPAPGGITPGVPSPFDPGQPFGPPGPGPVTHPGGDIGILGPTSDYVKYLSTYDRGQHKPEAMGESHLQTAGLAHVWKPQMLYEGELDFRSSSYPGEPSIRAAAVERPAVLRVEAFGKQTGREWVYTDRPGQSRNVGGTAYGGIAYIAPELDLMDRLATTPFAPSGVTRSPAYVVYTPGVYAAWGVPDTATGDLASGGFRAGYESGSLILRRYSGSAWDVAFFVASDKSITQADALMFRFGAADTTRPALRRSAATAADLAVRLADDSAYAAIDALALKVSGTQVVGAQGAAVADSTGILLDLTTQFNALLARLRAHGLIAT